MENIETEKKSNLRGKITKFAGATLLAGALVTGGLAIYDTTIDHTQEICPFASFLGIEHQLDSINNRTKYEATTGFCYTVPFGYVLEGNMGIKRSDEKTELINAIAHTTIFVTDPETDKTINVLDYNNLPRRR